MTTIIGIQENDQALLLADGLTTNDGRPFAGLAMQKIVSRGEYLLAAAGPGGTCDWITHVWKPPHYRHSGSVYDFLVTTAVPALIKGLRANDLAPSEKDDNSTWQLMLALDGQVFQVESDGTVLQDGTGLYGIGTGAPYALGALLAGATEQEALQIASTFDIYTKPPFQIVRQVSS
jgi:ATP-dependent protease HslVU (ClpYQ) peptidase subunit